MKIENDLYNYEKIKVNITYKDIISYIISGSGMVISTIHVINVFRNFSMQNHKVIVYNISIYLIILFINIYNFLNKRQIRMYEDNIKRLEENNKNLLEVNDNIRCFKHDFNNIIQAIEGYIYLNDMKALKVYFNTLLDDCNYVNTKDLLNCQAVGNPAIYGVLLNKCNIAKENNVNINIEILTNLNQLNEKSYIVARILGILIDNAIEATCECEEKVVNIQFIQEKNKNLVIIENTYMDDNIDMDKIFEKHYTTKKEKGNTGLGLWKIQDILKKDYSLELFTTKDEKMFKQKLEIYPHQKIK